MHDRLPALVLEGEVVLGEGARLEEQLTHFGAVIPRCLVQEAVGGGVDLLLEVDYTAAVLILEAEEHLDSGDVVPADGVRNRPGAVAAAQRGREAGVVSR